MVIINIILATLFFTTEINATTDNELKLEIQKSIEDLNQKSFSFFDLNLSEEEENIFENLNVLDEEFNVNCDLNSNFNKAIAEFFQKFGNSNEVSLQAAIVIEKIIKTILVSADKKDGWLAIRCKNCIDKPRYTTPRWHIDGRFVYSDANTPQENSDLQYKVVFSLKGPGTLLFELPANQRNTFNDLQNKLALTDFKEKQKILTFQEELNDFIKNIDADINSAALKGCVFIVGDTKRAAIHSEPEIPALTQRIFISFVPGAKEPPKT